MDKTKRSGKAGKKSKSLKIEMKEDFNVLKKSKDKQIIDDAVIIAKFKNGDIREILLSQQEIFVLLNIISVNFGGIKVSDEKIEGISFNRI